MLIIAKYCQADKSKILSQNFAAVLQTCRGRRFDPIRRNPASGQGGTNKLGGTRLQVQLSSTPRYNLETKLPPARFAISPKTTLSTSMTIFNVPGK